MPDGRWVRSVNKLLDNGWMMMLRQDVTDLKVQEMRLAREVEDAQIFRAAFEDLPVAVMLRDSQRRLVYANAAYGEMLGGDRQRYIGLTEEEMFPDTGTVTAMKTSNFWRRAATSKRARISSSTTVA